MLFEDDEPKPAPKEPKEESFSLGKSEMNTMIMVVALAAAFFLFKDEIMGIFNDLKGSLPGLGGAEEAPAGGGEAAPDQTYEKEDTQTSGAGDRMKKHKSERKKRGGGRRGKRGGRGGEDDSQSSGGEESYYSIANVNYY